MEEFFNWFRVKFNLRNNRHNPPFVSEGDIWWACLGENIGTEINGKGDSFARPVIILRKFSESFYFVIPTTSQMHSGKWYVHYDQNGKEIIACLHQARPIDYRRIRNRIGIVNPADMERIKMRFRELHEFETLEKIIPALAGGVTGLGP